MSWRDVAKHVQRAGHDRHDKHESPPSEPNVPSVPNVPGVPPLDAARALDLCRNSLIALDPLKPLHGQDVLRWRRLLDDSLWLLKHFAEQAFRDAWWPSELFGQWWHDGTLVHHAGGIADRIDGSRSLMMTADRAHWRTMFSGEPMQFSRGAYADRLLPLWETPHA